MNLVSLLAITLADASSSVWDQPRFLWVGLLGAVAAAVVGTFVVRTIVGMQLRRHESIEARWHQETREALARALEAASRFPATVAGQHDRILRELAGLKRTTDDHAREIATIKGAAGEVEKRLRAIERKP